jgi:hypothetical protein
MGPASMRTFVALLALATLLLWPAPADAQPLFRRERVWTVEVGGRTWGWFDVGFDRHFLKPADPGELVTVLYAHAKKLAAERPRS